MVGLPPLWPDGLRCSFDRDDFLCCDFTCCIFYGPFLVCPECGEVLHLLRIGYVGLAGETGRPDSELIRCLACTHVWRARGQTWREAHGFWRG